MRVVCIKICDTIEAEAAKALLAAEGIPAELAPYSEAAASAVVGGMPLMSVLVRDQDQAAALAALALTDSEGAYVTDYPPLSLAEARVFVQDDLRRDYSQAEIAARLVERGWELPAAQRFVAQQSGSTRAYSPSHEQRAEEAQQGLKRMGRGLAQSILGVALTLSTGWLATNTGLGISLIFYGLIIWGLIEIGLGFSAWSKNRE